MGQALAGYFQCPLVIEEVLKEKSFGQYEVMTKVQLACEHFSEFLALFSQNVAFCPPVGESLARVSERIIHFLHEIMVATIHQTFCVVTHGHAMQGSLRC